MPRPPTRSDRGIDPPEQFCGSNWPESHLMCRDSPDWVDPAEDVSEETALAAAEPRPSGADSAFGTYPPAKVPQIIRAAP